jgi:hypothetical protein
MLSWVWLISICSFFFAALCLRGVDSEWANVVDTDSVYGLNLLTVHQCYFFGHQGVRGRQKINCLGLWRSEIMFFGGIWRPEGRQVNNSTGELWRSRTPTN